MKKDKCIQCGKTCKTKKFYVGWDPICSDECYMEYSGVK